MFQPFPQPRIVVPPKLIVDSFDLGPGGDDFLDATLNGWLQGGTAPIAAKVADGTELFDPDSVIDFSMPAVGSRILRPFIPFATYYLTFHGINNDANTPTTARGGMLSLCITDDSGTGTGVSMYDDGIAYNWAMGSFAYAGTGAGIANPGYPTLGPPGSHALAASGMPMIYRISKSGSTVTTAISANGGASWAVATRSDSTTHTKVGVCRLFGNGGSNPRLRLGRFTVVLP